MTVPIIRPVNRWYCPNCAKRDVTHEARPHVRFHTCLGLRGLTAPLLPEGVKAKVEAKEREDYVGREMVQLDPERGRPVQSIVTTRDEGQDCAVLLPAATMNGVAPQ